MRLSGLLESFFIISLAILFILVGLLLYHIRGRLNTGEQRVDNLYEIVTNMSNEIGALKVHLASMRYATTSYMGGCGGGGMCEIPPNVEIHKIENEKIIVSDDECETDDECDECDECDEDMEELIETEVENSIGDGFEEYTQHQEEDHPHIVDATIHQDIHVLKLNHDDLELSCEDVMNIEVVSDVAPTETAPIADATTQEIEPSLDISVENDMTATEEDEKEDFHKMTTSSLKKLVVERGLVQDASRLKKTDLIHLLLGETAV